jgi:hypothetical protein
MYMPRKRFNKGATSPSSIVAVLARTLAGVDEERCVTDQYALSIRAQQRELYVIVDLGVYCGCRSREDEARVAGKSDRQMREMRICVTRKGSIEGQGRTGAEIMELVEDRQT